MTFPLNNILSTKEIGKNSQYFSTPSEFYTNFPSAWNTVKSQVLKLETRQSYYDASWKEANRSLELYNQGKFEEAIKLLYYFRSSDVELYQSLKKRKIDFIRCRPVEFPIIDYLKWEIECYHFNAFYCEQIYFSKRNDLADLFDNIAQHDYMVFDRQKAIIHNYNDFGELQGGWLVLDPKYIDNLIMLYSIIRASSLEYSIFLEKYAYQFK